MKISPVAVVWYFDEQDPRSPAIRPDPPKTCLKDSIDSYPVRTVAQILKELRNASNVEYTQENNLDIRI